ncbi:MAG: hypothetical protein NT031_15500 [Planctomycetota bacterium]|nr:hypothetical protein [Planctomycetota bacterium]
MKVDPAEATRLQRCAAMAIGWMRRREALPDLQAVLAHAEDGPVRVACAMSVLRIVDRAPGVIRDLPAPSPKAQPAGEPAQRKQPRKPQVHSAEAKE